MHLLSQLELTGCTGLIGHQGCDVVDTDLASLIDGDDEVLRDRCMNRVGVNPNHSAIASDDEDLLLRYHNRGFIDRFEG